MEKREKILLSAVLGMGGLFLAGVGVDQYLIQPANNLDRRITARLNELQELSDLQQDANRATHRMQQLAARTYGDQPDRVTATAGERIATLIQEAGLSPSDFTRTPLSPRRLRGAQEVGWSVQGRGPLTDVIDFLYLLQAEPVVHRIDNLSLTARDGVGGPVSVQFRFVTLVIDAVPPPVKREPLEPRWTLADERRELYAGLVKRDLFRPYVPRPPAPAHEEPQQREAREPAPPPPPGPETYRVVSLTQWGDEREVHVHDANEGRTRRYVEGDELAGGRIVMVDYRPLPLPNNEALRSESRVIVEIDSTYWAIERGQTLAEKYSLEGDRLPLALRKGARASVAGAQSEEGDEVR